jgi:hypothetical protein
MQAPPSSHSAKMRVRNLRLSSMNWPGATGAQLVEEQECPVG